MDQYIMDFIVIINLKEKENLQIQMVNSMKDNGLKELKMEKDFLKEFKVKLILVNGNQVNHKDTVYQLILMVIDFKVNLKTLLKMVKESKSSLMVIFTKGLIKMENQVDMANIIGKIKVFLKVNLKMV